jgi:hypothetical protein
MSQFASYNSNKSILFANKLNGKTLKTIRKKNGVNIGVFEMELDTTLGNGAAQVGWEIQANGYEIYWGDGTAIESNGQSHTYSSGGTYIVRTVGEFKIEDYAGVGSIQGKVTKINDWSCFYPVQQNSGDFGFLRDSVQDDTLAIGTFPYAVEDGSANGPAGSIFASSDGDFVSLGSWKFKNGVQYNYERMFESCSAFSTPGIGTWQDELGNPISWTGIGVFRSFTGCTLFNDNLNGWDVADCTSFATTFRSCSSFNQPLDSWDVNNCENFSSMFLGCSVFSQDISGWQITTDPAKSVTMASMFQSAGSASGSLTGSLATVGAAWNMDRVTSVSDMFRGGRTNPSSCANWNVGNVTSFNNFARQNNYFDADVSGWTLPTTAFTMNSMFFGSRDFAGTGMASWVVTPCTDFRSFLNMDPTPGRRNDVWNINIGSWDISNASLGITSMFEGCRVNNFGETSGTNHSNIANWVLPNVTTLSRMFLTNNAFNGNLPTDAVNGYWDVSSIQNFNQLFSSCTVFNGNIDNWDVSSATVFTQMFASCSAFNRDIRGWTLPATGTIDCNNMFSATTSFVSYDLDAGGTQWNIRPNICRDMFRVSAYPHAIVQNTGGWDFSSCTDFHGMFQSSSWNHSISTWDVTLATDMSDMFNGSNAWANGGADFGSGIGGTLVRSTFASTCQNMQTMVAFSDKSGVATLVDARPGYCDFRYTGGAGLNLTSAFGSFTEDAQIDSLVLWSQNTNIATGVNAVTVFRTAIIDRTTTTALGNTGADAEAAEAVLTGTYSWTITGISYIN